MPLLARIADEKYHAGYGAVYALAQTSVALAYSLGKIFALLKKNIRILN